MDIDFSRPPFAVVVAKGEVDLAGSPALADALVRARGTTDKILVDLSGVSLIDSTGVGALVSARKRHEAVGGRFGLVLGPQRSVRLVFSTMGLNEYFPIYETVDAALSD